MIASLVLFSTFIIGINGNHSVSKTLLVRRFQVQNQGQLELECPENTALHSVEAFTDCLDDYQKGILTPNRPQLHAELRTAHEKYCTAQFKNNQKCVLNLNKDSPGADRFRTKLSLRCDNVIFVGVYWCVAKNPSEVADGEIVMVFDEEKKPLHLKCPANKVVHVTDAQRFGSSLCDHGLRYANTLEVEQLCNGKQECTVSKTGEAFNNCAGLATYHGVTFTCLDKAAVAAAMQHHQQLVPKV